MAAYAARNEKVNPLSLPKDYARKMKEQPKYKWYKPILATLLAGLLYLIFGLTAYTFEQIYSSAVIDPTAANLAINDAYIDTDFTDPIAIVLAMLDVICMIPAVAIAMRATGLGGLRTLSSEQGGVRWDRYKKIYPLVFAFSALLIVGTTIAELVLTGSLDSLVTARFAPLALLAIFIVVPLQGAAEEYVFRGFLMQAFGSWIPVVIIAVVVESIFFALVHSYDLLGNMTILVNGLLWGWIVLKTGGLEAAVCIHAANNVVGMMLASVFVETTPTSSTTVENFIFNVAVSVAVCVFTYYLCKRNGFVISDKREVEPA